MKSRKVEEGRGREREDRAWGKCKEGTERGKEGEVDEEMRTGQRGREGEEGRGKAEWVKRR
jgi:hypothetical protein